MTNKADGSGRGMASRALDMVGRAGNRPPDPMTLFIAGPLVYEPGF